MNAKILLISLFFLLTILAIVTPVRAETFDMMKVPTYIDNQLGVGEFIGGMLASIFVLMLTLVPLMVLTKGKQYTVYIIVAVAVMAPLVGLGWFPLWVYILIILAIAVGLGRQISDAIGGVRSGF
jgi:ABC-type multidrug transport system permease subunit